MNARRSESFLAALLVVAAIGLTGCDPGDCGPSEPPEVRWDGAFTERTNWNDGGTMTIDTANGVVRVEATDRSGQKVVTTWKIRSGAEYEAARAAKAPK